MHPLFDWNGYTCFSILKSFPTGGIAMLKKSKVIQQNSSSSAPSTPAANQHAPSSPPAGYTKKSGCGCGKRR